MLTKRDTLTLKETNIFGGKKQPGKDSPYNQ